MGDAKETEAKNEARTQYVDRAGAAALGALVDDQPAAMCVVALWPDFGPTYSVHGSPATVARACKAVHDHLAQVGLDRLVLAQPKAEAPKLAAVPDEG